MDTIKINSGKTLMVAHRGMSGIEKENTFAAFVAAGNRNHYGIETDVHVTVDGKFVCIHDDTTGRVAIDNLVVEESTFDTLRNLLLTDVDGKKGRTDLRIPTLQEYIQICKKYGKVAVLELKNHFTPENVMRIVDVIKGEGYLEHVIFISFDYENMLTIRRLLPDQPAQFLTKEIDDALIEKLEKDHLDLDVKHVALTKEMIETLHAHNIVVNCWTVDDPARAEELVSWGVALHHQQHPAGGRCPLTIAAALGRGEIGSGSDPIPYVTAYRGLSTQFSGRCAAVVAACALCLDVVLQKEQSHCRHGNAIALLHR